MTVVALTIDGTAQTQWFPRTLIVQDRLRGRSILNVSVDDEAAALGFLDGLPVTVTEDGVATFAGFLADPDIDRRSHTVDQVWKLRAVDNTYLVDKRRVAEAYEDKTVREIVVDLLEDYFAAEGVTAWYEQYAAFTAASDEAEADYVTPITSTVFKMRCELRFADWSSGIETIGGQWEESGDNRNHLLLIAAAPGEGLKPSLQLSYDGAAYETAGPGAGNDFLSVFPDLDSDSRLLLEIERDGTAVTFNVSDDDGATWTLLGSDTVSAGSLHSSTAAFKVGAQTDGSGRITGDVFEVRWYSDGAQVAAYEPSVYYRTSDDAFAWDEGDTAVADEQGNTWTATAELITRDWAVEDDSAQISIVFDWVPGGDALDRLAERLQLWWRLTPDRVLELWLRETYSVPDPITADDMFATPRPTVTTRGTKYRNTQIIRGGKSITSSQTEDFVGDGTRQTFNVGYPVHQVPTVTLDTGGGFAAQTVGIRGIDTGKDWYWNKASTEITQELADTAIAASDTLRVVYIGEYPLIVKSTDDDQVDDRRAVDGTSGIVEAVYQDPSVASPTDGSEVAEQLLAQYGFVPRQLRFVTDDATWAQIGRIIIVDLPDEGLDSAQMLIDQVTRTHVQGAEMEYRIRAVEGPAGQPWTAYFRWLASPEARRLEDSEVSTTVAIFETISEMTDVAEATTITVVNCGYPSTSEYPDESTYPC